jgi:hypothetical protein
MPDMARNAIESGELFSCAFFDGFVLHGRELKELKRKNIKDGYFTFHSDYFVWNISCRAEFPLLARLAGVVWRADDDKKR